jgi:hypothetical protein
MSLVACSAGENTIQSFQTVHRLNNRVSRLPEHFERRLLSASPSIHIWFASHVSKQSNTDSFGEASASA